MEPAPTGTNDSHEANVKPPYSPEASSSTLPDEGIIQKLTRGSPELEPEPEKMKIQVEDQDGNSASDLEDDALEDIIGIVNEFIRDEKWLGYNFSA